MAQSAFLLNPGSQYPVTTMALAFAGHSIDEAKAMIGYGGKEMANAFRTVRNNTVQIAEEIPEDSYDFEAAPGANSVRMLLSHLVFAPMFYESMHGEERITTLKGYDFGAAIGRAGAREREPRSKAQIVELLKTEGARLEKWLESLSPEFLAETFTDPTGQNPKTRFESLLSIKEHEMHHRGQLMLIQRMLGMVPHLTRQREERARARQAATAGV